MRFSSTAAVARWGSGLLLWSLAGCVDSYLPDVINAPSSYLVVDGFINGNGATRIKLSRTQNIAATTAPLVETKATLYVVDDQGARYLMRESSAGFYKSDSVVLNPARQYQLRIATAGAATYESDLVPLKVTPPIDKLDWVHQADNITVRLSTHDASQQARYYRWKYSETWQFNSAFNSVLEYYPQSKSVLARTTPIYTCWRTEATNSIKQGSTAQLSQDVVTNQPLVSFSNRAERIKVRYSILVTQNAETAEEFAYYELLRKNTEAVGTVNDPLPVQLTGNVHRTGTNTAEPVLGYVGAHTLQVQRFFINRQDLNLPISWLFDTPYTTCTLSEELVPDPRDKNPIYMPYTRVYGNQNAVPVDYSYSPTGARQGYIGSTQACVDCRVRGTNVKPSFW